jgi:hypothetical protein
MDAFIRQHLSLVLSTLYLLIGFCAAGYVGLYLPAVASRADLLKAKAYFAKENASLKKNKNSYIKLNDKTKKRGNSIPNFLRRINKLANDHKVIIRKLVPDKKDNLKFTIEMFGNYYLFTEFAGSLEGLNVTVHDLEVRPYDATKSPPVHFIKFSITPRNDAEPLTMARIDTLSALTRQKNKRNPFQRFAARTGRSCVDQTWVHTLSGIGTINNKKVATIDSVDYSVGEMVQTLGMKIVSIDASRVEFVKEASTGKECHILKFRQKKPNSPQRGLR